ncbi:uncharacterized protein LOC134827806 isoform X2 [Culicoides brevitarsis]|uniref:uncharacterized protein LOC134827806 isoform X2 n=1 Tax=Culicoides brevitarsis TaxID=469753 RepID=UPI00307C8E2F
MEGIIDIGIIEFSSPKKRSITYTEDKVPIKTLYVSSIKPTVNHDDLNSYFSRLGALKSVVLHDKGDHKYAFVTYETYEDATKALKKRHHNVKGSKLRVRPADTWHQPKPEAAATTKNATETQETENSSNAATQETYDENAPSLMMLNDDCLLHMLKLLNILELIKVHGTCRRLDFLIDSVCQKYSDFNFTTLSFELSSDLTLMNARDILMFLGPRMKSLSIDGSDFNSSANRTIDWIARFCKTLESLELENFNLNKLIIKKLKPVIQNLKSFSIGDSTKVGDELGMCFHGASSLEELTISGNWEITGKCLTKLSDLKTLSVNCCGNLQSKPFKEALLKNKTLKKLEIRRCDKFDDSVVNCIVAENQEIEELSLSNVYPSMSNYSHFADLPRLKKLSVEFHSFAPIDSLLEKLATKNILEELHYIGSSSHPVTKTIEHISQITNLKTFSMAFNANIGDAELKMLQNLTNLESFSIPGATNVTSESLLALLAACKNIKYLDVSQIRVNIGFIEKLLTLLKQSASRPKLEIIMYETEIDEDSEEVQEIFKENRFYIQPSFVPKMLNTYQFMFNGSDLTFGDSDDEFLDLIDDDDDDFGDGFAPPWEVYGDQWWDSDDSDKYMYGWGQYSGDRSPVGW